MAGQDDEGDRDTPVEPETNDGLSPRWLPRAQAIVLVLQGVVALATLIGDVGTLCHWW